MTQVCRTERRPGTSRPHRSMIRIGTGCLSEAVTHSGPVRRLCVALCAGRTPPLTVCAQTLWPEWIFKGQLTERRKSTDPVSEENELIASTSSSEVFKRCE